MRYLSVCSGIEAATVAWAPLGFVPAAFAEIAKHPSQVLAHRWPGVPNLGDFTAIDAGALGPIDLLTGGTPCQAFSVAGRRASLADRRGNLTLAFADLFHALVETAGTRWALWENVPGVLSLADNAFGCFLGRLVGGDDALPLPLGAGRWPDAGLVAGPRARAAWRILDAQYFGLAQRRRRVFVVVGAGDGTDPAAVLLERQGVRRHPPSRGEAGPGVAGTLDASAGGRDENDATGGRLIAAFGGNDTRGAIEVATALNAHGGPCGRQDFESETFVVAAALRARDGARGVDSDCTDTLVTHSLRGEGFDASEDGTGRGTPIVPVCFDTTQITHRENRCNPQPGDPCHPLSAGAHPPAIALLGGRARATESGKRTGASTHRRAGDGIGEIGDPMFTLGADSRHAVATAGSAWAVRRLTPAECHRLQGFPDDHAAIPGAADGPVYMALGNSQAVPVMRWIGERIAAVHTSSFLQAAE